MSRSVFGAALLLLALALASCGGGDSGATPTPAPTSTPAATAVPASTGSDEPAERDLVDLAARLGGAVDPPRRVTLPEPALGDFENFAITVLSEIESGNSRTTAQMEVRAITEHAYFFVQTDAGFSDAQMDAAASVFENEVWSVVTAEFGPPPDPGVDGDSRIAIVYANIGEAVGGYVNGEDTAPREASPHSNQREAVYLNLTLEPGGDRYRAVLAHELQHLIHERLDNGEDSWINEGLSEQAAQLVGAGTGFFSSYLDKPDTQLDNWSLLGGGSAASYGAAALFLTYLFEQTSGSPRDLADEQADSIAGVRAYLQAQGAARTFEQFVADWLVANEVDAASGPYGYRDRDVSPPEKTPVIGPASETTDVQQFGGDYFAFDGDDFTSTPSFAFDGDTEVPVIPAQPDADGAFWWSGRGDNIDATLTRALDLTDVESATLTYRLWYDIEDWFDYGYVVVSDDGGATWDTLAGGHTTLEDPLDVSYGPGYTRSSDGWVLEQVDLSRFAGSEVLLRFELINDDSANGGGIALDDIAVPEIGFFDDAETDVGNWHREGFRRVSEPLAQRFALRLITYGDAPEVLDIELDSENDATVDLSGLGTDYRDAVILVTALTEGTTVPAAYRYSVTQ